ncbi:excinuclease ABC subunit UvrC [Nevskia ramosa]|uniref:excinuclease ABC subunit UvrC n=1 Tax=Nevskia ramosa TaxID=64002 RepID=UPI0003B3897F|nr:excinuclease ABC subunit UvrC [Nevskia ramosa]
MSEPLPSPFDSRAFLSQLTSSPGVYRMYDVGNELLYVGKARNLKKRVSSYFLRASGNPRIESMVDQISRIEVSLTHTEDEALLLEATLIKEQNPRYNVSLRDDKSYPYVKITNGHDYPRIGFHRGGKDSEARYFGPFPSATAVRETLYTLQKLFRLRPCNDSFFANRRRPCLQHQIRRCSAPCVKMIAPEDYALDVARAVRLLEGRGDELAKEIGTEMEAAAEALEFERAAKLRDQIAALARVRENRAITGGADEIDVIAVAQHPSASCIVVTSVRDGLNLGHGSFFPKHPHGIEIPELLGSFLGQYYLNRPVPPEVLISHQPDDLDWIETTLAHAAGRKVKITEPQRGPKQRLMEMAINTANQALSTRLVEAASMDKRLLELQQALDLDAPPRRLECFDISHSMGELPVASCVVFNEEGPLKIAYRKFNIEGITPGDDYAAIKQAVSRRFARVKAGEVQVPDVLFIDGGAGQLASAVEALAELNFDGVRIVAIAKGPTRRPGLEQLILPERDQPIVLPPDSPALHLIQRIRDEAHRFAITGHRARRDKARITSGLEAIEGLGPTRRRALLNSLGGLGQIKRAGIDELAKVEGINRRLAERIYAHFH